jgi:hypothetical protein
MRYRARLNQLLELLQVLDVLLELRDLGILVRDLLQQLRPSTSTRTHQVTVDSGTIVIAFGVSV